MAKSKSFNEGLMNRIMGSYDPDLVKKPVLSESPYTRPAYTITQPGLKDIINEVAKAGKNAISEGKEQQKNEPNFLKDVQSSLKAAASNAVSSPEAKRRAEAFKSRITEAEGASTSSQPGKSQKPLLAHMMETNAGQEGQEKTTSSDSDLDMWKNTNEAYQFPNPLEDIASMIRDTSSHPERYFASPIGNISNAVKQDVETNELLGERRRAGLNMLEEAENEKRDKYRKSVTSSNTKDTEDAKQFWRNVGDLVDTVERDESPENAAKKFSAPTNPFATLDIKGLELLKDFKLGNTSAPVGVDMGRYASSYNLNNLYDYYHKTLEENGSDFVPAVRPDWDPYWSSQDNRQVDTPHDVDDTFSALVQTYPDMTMEELAEYTERSRDWWQSTITDGSLVDDGKHPEAYSSDLMTGEEYLRQRAAFGDEIAGSRPFDDINPNGIYSKQVEQERYGYHPYINSRADRLKYGTDTSTFWVSKIFNDLRNGRIQASGGDPTVREFWKNGSDSKLDRGAAAGAIEDWLVDKFGNETGDLYNIIDPVSGKRISGNEFENAYRKWNRDHPEGLDYADAVDDLSTMDEYDIPMRYGRERDDGTIEYFPANMSPDWEYRIADEDVLKLKELSEKAKKNNNSLDEDDYNLYMSLKKSTSNVIDENGNYTGPWVYDFKTGNDADNWVYDSFDAGGEVATYPVQDQRYATSYTEADPVILENGDTIRADIATDMMQNPRKYSVDYGPLGIAKPHPTGLLSKEMLTGEKDFSLGEDFVPWYYDMMTQSIPLMVKSLGIPLTIADAHMQSRGLNRGYDTATGELTLQNGGRPTRATSYGSMLGTAALMPIEKALGFGSHHLIQKNIEKALKLEGGPNNESALHPLIETGLLTGEEAAEEPLSDFAEELQETGFTNKFFGDPLYYYNTPKLDENGNVVRDENGYIVFDTIYTTETRDPNDPSKLYTPAYDERKQRRYAPLTPEIVFKNWGSNIGESLAGGGVMGGSMSTGRHAMHIPGTTAQYGRWKMQRSALKDRGYHVANNPNDLIDDYDYTSFKAEENELDDEDL